MSVSGHQLISSIALRSFLMAALTMQVLAVPAQGSGCDEATLEGAPTSDEVWRQAVGADAERVRLLLRSRLNTNKGRWVVLADPEWTQEALVGRQASAGSSEFSCVPWHTISRIDRIHGTQGPGKGIVLGALAGFVGSFIATGIIVETNDIDHGLGGLGAFLYSLAVLVPVGAVAGGILSSHRPGWRSIACLK